MALLGCAPRARAFPVAGTLARQDTASVEVTAKPDTGGAGLYTGNRTPLLPSALIKLPIRSIQPEGWLRTQLQLMADGFPGHLPEVSHWVQFQNNAWTSPTGQGENGWEEVPYWLRGYGDLGYVLNNPRITAEFEKWTDAILASQRPDGYFGPADNEKNFDIWPNMLALYALRTRFEATGDPRIVPFMLRYFKWEQSVPPEKFLPGSWQKVRGGDNLDSIYWLYNQTGEAWLLDFAKFNHDRTLDWTTGVHDFHGVNVAQSFREPATFYQQSKDPKFLQATINDYNQYWGTFGQVPGGMYGADENARPGYTGPRQGAETCAMVDAMFSHEILEGITGDPIWADRTEDIAFNSLPASVTADIRGLHYLTSPNMVQLDSKNKSPMLQDGGTMISYDPGEVYRCCQHNYVMGWPYFAEHTWMATGDKGIAAVLYAPVTVDARVGDGAEVIIQEGTKYPFDGRIDFGMQFPALHDNPSKAAFPFLLRIPGWCTDPQVSINGKAQAIPTPSSGWIRLNRTWKAGDRVSLTLPMPLRAKVWTQNRNAVSIYRGPLAFSLNIGEQSKRYGGTDKWPATEVYPTTPWNYGMVLDPANPSASIKVVQKAGAMAAQPFTPEGSPISLIAQGKKIPQWGQEDNGLVEEIQTGPIRSAEPTEPITLIPMGAARLRISAFPQIGDGPDAKDWVPRKRTPHDLHTKFTYSYLNPNDSPLSSLDPVQPANSADDVIPRFTWWDHKGTTEWVQYEFDKQRTIKSSDVYWFDDARTNGGCRIPDSWQLRWWDGAAWQPVTHPTGQEVKSDAAFGARLDAFNHLSFDPVKTTRIRIIVQLQKGYSGGILAWRVGE
ncbi:MAG: glycoside hydrolase family 127 protein [Armatimonadota bacterium]|nr:glycoside hydrolase family 127 protein [Armatimonadota bacterium]